MNIVENDIFNNSNYILPKIIYSFWDNLENDLLIQSFIKNWKNKFSKEWEIIFMSKKTVHKYVSNEFLKKYGTGQMDVTRFSDFLRLELLTKNGGVWLDASIMIIDGKFLDDYYNEMIRNNYDGSFYEFKEKKLDNSLPYIENWFMMAPKNSKILTDLYYEFNRAFEMDFLKYKFEVLASSGIPLYNTVDYGNNTYLLQHAIFNYLFKKNNKYNITLKNATENMYKIHKIFQWNSKSMFEYILLNDNWKNYIAIKLTKGNREEIKNINEFIKKLEKL